MDEELLSTWREGPTKDAIVEFVGQVAGSDDVPEEHRVAVFDNDGTLWCEKPMPIQLDFILRRLSDMAESQPELRQRQPWKAAYERDYTWLGTVIAEHLPTSDEPAHPQIRRGTSDVGDERRVCPL